MLVNRKQLTISLPPEMIEWAKAEADKNYMSVGRFIEKLLSEHRQKKEEG